MFWGRKKNPNVIEYAGIDRETLLSSGYVDTMLRVLVVDTHRPQPETQTTLLIESRQTVEAGIVAQGYFQLLDELRETRQAVTEALKTAVIPLGRSPIVKQTLTGRLSKDIADALSGNNADVYTQSVEGTVFLLDQLSERVERAVEALLPGTRASTPDAAIASGLETQRRLPHCLR